MRPPFKLVWSAIALAVHAITSANAAPAEPLVVRTAPIPLYPNAPNERRAGSLLYRGGVQLSSSDRRFGGWSDLAVSADGREILAISDEAHWLRAKLSYAESGDLASMSDAQIAPMLDLAGKPMRGKEGDAEGLALERANDLNGPVVVSFERDVRVWRYDLTSGFAARPHPIPIGDWTKALRTNAQLEALTLIKPETLLVLAESRIGGEDIRAAFETYSAQAGANSRPLSVVPNAPFLVTGAANAPEGGILILERRYSLLGGVGMEVRRVGAGELKPGARIEGEVLANLSFQDANIDNMEGIAVRRGAEGETLLYLISDDNFSPLQRTLLLMFELNIR
jgi:hypothetical protein